MSLRDFTIYFLIISALYSYNMVLAETMSSGSYKIQSDSINIAGVHSTSTNYQMEDTTGEVATGLSTSTNYGIKAGYQQMQGSYLAVTAASNVSLSPSIAGVTGGTANGSTNFTVTTDNAAGYTVMIKASTTPSLQSATDSFADYSATALSPDFSFGIAATESAFAFSPEGADIASSFKDNGSTCATGSSDTSDKCWAGLSTSNQTIANRTSSNQPSGTVTTIKFRAQSGSSHIQKEGNYVSTTTVTVISL